MTEPSIEELCAPISAKVAPKSAAFSSVSHVPLTDSQARTSQRKAASSIAFRAMKKRGAK